MWCTMSPKSSPNTGAGQRAKITAAPAAAAIIISLVLSIVVSFLLRSRLLGRRRGIVVFVLLMAAVVVAGNTEMALEFAELAHVDEADDIDDGELGGFGHQDRQTGNCVALFQYIDLVVFSRFPAVALNDAAPSGPGQLRANRFHVFLRVLVGTVELKVLDVNAL